MVMNLQLTKKTIQCALPFLFLSVSSVDIHLISLLAMDGKNDTSKLFVKVLDNVPLMQKIVDRNIAGHYHTTNRFNTSCTEKMQCGDTAMFCNAWTLLCDCTRFYSWNDKIKLCELNLKEITDWLNRTSNNKQTNDIIYLNVKDFGDHLPKYSLPWSILSIMIISCLCFFSCIIYICIGQNKVDEDKTVSAALCKQHGQHVQAHRLLTPIVENI
ncbi:uncharacterized protein LOC113549288 [Rhopalosiphum maidis]|uniref:uncharacterized protein LOC113549288 n=1 Tax=Rhopalosiphum maidis TaxID=43146 RepID=UPI000EFEE88C|nr:uncharacterized protein LOC113549288 [Rhopalosiphum maidis]